jgi:hypothetical protein
MIDKERARLSLEIGEFNFGNIPVVNYKITCHGTTPAYIVSSWEMTNLNPIPDFGWPEDAFGLELQKFPSVLPVGIFEGYNFIMGTDRKAISMTPSTRKSVLANFTFTLESGFSTGTFSIALECMNFKSAKSMV